MSVILYGKPVNGIIGRADVDASAHLNTNDIGVSMMPDSKSTKQTRTCIVDGCMGKLRSSKYCPKHYSRYVRGGDPLVTSIIVGDDVSRFLSYVGETNERGCVLWRGQTNQHGYGVIYIKGRMVFAHRHAYEVKHGPISHGMLACHRCDNPQCVNSDHIFIGTHAENSKDMAEKGRSTRGSRQPNSKLHESDIFEILRRSGDTHSVIADDYSVSRATISLIMSGKTWRHVTR